ncbi:MAG: efflux RND transporter permease subunit, partial [Bacteroidota bacterium]
MLNKIVQFSLQNRLLIILVFTALIVAGIFVSNSMDIDVFPDFTAPTVVVMTEAHGMASEEVEKLVTFPIESAMNGSMSVRRIRSSSSTGFSIVFVEFDWGTDLFRARQVVGEKLLTIKSVLPEGVGEPTLAPQSSIMGEIMFISLTSDSTSPMALRSLADWKLRPALLGLGGIAQVTVIGGELKQYQVEADPYLMYLYGVSLNELYGACDDINANAPGGIINQYGNEYVVTGIGRSGNVEDMGESVVKSYGDTIVLIKDVATIKIVPAPKLGDGSLNAKPAVLLSITKQPDINTVDLTHRIDVTMEQIRNDLPHDIIVNTQIFRQSDFIESSVKNVQSSLIEGALFVVIILAIFLLNFRLTFISVLAIPISLLITVIVIRLMGYTINTMSLGGMAIAIGALVDDAIIFVDNVFRRLKQNNSLMPENQKSSMDVIFLASGEIRSSIVNATAIIIVSFIPLFFLGGMEGRMLKPLGISFIVALASSLLVAITLTPVLCSYFLVSPKMLNRQKAERRTVAFLYTYYQRSLQWVMENSKKVLWITGVLLIGSILLYSTFGRSFLPEFNEGSLTLTVVTLPGISLEESNKIGNQVESLLLSIPEVKSTSRKTGRSELDEHAQSVNGAEIDVPFTLDKRSRDEFMKDVRTRLKSIRGVNVIVGQPLGHRIDHMLSGTRANIAIKIFGPDNATLLDLGNNVATAIRPIPGVVDVSPEQMTAVPQVKIIPRREVMSRLGVTMKDFHDAVDIAIAGKKIGEIYEGTGKFDLVLRYPANVRDQLEKLGDIMV